ncbi:MAG: hypothetical protein J0L82_01985 [Deltaproteobacteria bacterium]|nr:hypothetical protein [Deltaproteobacteria bacterium]
MKNQTQALISRLVHPQMLIRISQSLLALLAIVGFVAVVHPDVRTSVRGSLRSDFRTVVSTAKGDLSGTGVMFTVAKIKTRDNIYLEIFETVIEQTLDGESESASSDSEAGSAAPRLVERIEIPDARDAFFSFNGQATNLAIDDVNGDGRPEILVPTFDRNLVGRLNVFEYNNDTREFSRVIR